MFISFSILKIYFKMSQNKKYIFVEKKIKLDYYERVERKKKNFYKNKHILSLEYQLNWYPCLMFYFQEHLGSRCDELIRDFIEETNEFPINECIADEDSHEESSIEQKSLKLKRDDSQEESSQRRIEDQEIIEISEDEDIDLQKIKDNELDIISEDVQNYNFTLDNLQEESSKKKQKIKDNELDISLEDVQNYNFTLDDLLNYDKKNFLICKL
jgi:hypothetical protein